MEEWPVHHDPNFGALTYGETGSRPAYIKLLRSLEQGDIIAFYTGLKNEQSHSYTHRYLIGYMTVNSVCDIQEISDQIETKGGAADIKDTFRKNAHIKRFNASGKIDKEAVLVDGKTPGGRLKKAIRISKHQGRGHHYMTDKAQQLLQPVPGGNQDRNAYLGGIKKALDILLRLQAEESQALGYYGLQTPCSLGVNRPLSRSNSKTPGCANQPLLISPVGGL